SRARRDYRLLGPVAVRELLGRRVLPRPQPAVRKVSSVYLQAKNLGFCRFVILIGDEPLIQHLLELAEFRHWVLRLRGLLRLLLFGLRLLLLGRLAVALLLWRLLAVSLLLGLLAIPLLRGLLTVALLTGHLGLAGMLVAGLLEAARGAGGRAHPHPHERHAGTAAGGVFPRSLEPARSSLLHEGVPARARQRVGLLDVGEEGASVLVVLDRLDRDLDDHQAAVGGPLIALLDRCAERLGEAEGIGLDPRDPVPLIGVVRVEGECGGEAGNHLGEQLVRRVVVE